jgi:hypothetical protein
MGRISCVLDVVLPRDLLWKTSCSLKKQETIFLRNKKTCPNSILNEGKEKGEVSRMKAWIKV